MKILIEWRAATITIETEDPWKQREALGELVKAIILSEYESMGCPSTEELGKMKEERENEE